PRSIMSGTAVIPRHLARWTRKLPITIGGPAMKNLFRKIALGAAVLGAIVAIHTWTGTTSTAMVPQAQAKTTPPSVSPAAAPTPSPATSHARTSRPLPSPTPPAVPVPGEPPPPPPPPNPCSPGYWKNHTELWVGTAACDGYVSPCGGATGCDALLNDLKAK